MESQEYFHCLLPDLFKGVFAKHSVRESLFDHMFLSVSSSYHEEYDAASLEGRLYKYGWGGVEGNCVFVLPKYYAIF